MSKKMKYMLHSVMDGLFTNLAITFFTHPCFDLCFKACQMLLNVCHVLTDTYIRHQSVSCTFYNEEHRDSLSVQYDLFRERFFEVRFKVLLRSFA